MTAQRRPHQYALPNMLGGATRRRIPGLLAVGLLAAAAGLAVHAAGLINWVERDTVDARFSLRGRSARPRDVVVVGIDNDSLGVLPRFPVLAHAATRACSKTCTRPALA